LANLQVQELIEAGIHFGHPASRWNPKMAPYIYGKRNFIHIIDLKETVKGIIRAKKFLTKLVATGKDAVFVGTKRQARAAVEQEAKRCGMPYVSYRWLGGTLTNFRTIRSRLSHLEELDEQVTSGAINALSKKMQSNMQREHRKMKRNLDGLRTMDRMPGAMIIVDPTREKNAIREAKKLGIPIVALADTEADPDDISVIIPGNDDAMRAIEIVMKQLADAVAEGMANRAARAAIEGEGQALTRAVSRPKARGAARQESETPPAPAPKPAFEMPLPKPHPAIQDAGADDAGKAAGDAPAAQ
jgi:small subunit ribosomal protein S2